jgi:ribosome recycling factor
MEDEKRERWMRLCVEVADEQDSNRLLELISEVNHLLHEKEMRLRNVRREASGYVIEAEKKASYRKDMFLGRSCVHP